MNNSKRRREPIMVMRKRECNKLADAYISGLETKGYMIDAYANDFIRRVFERVLISNKAYRVYHALDKNSLYYDEARSDIKFGTKHHMYLSENNLIHGMPDANWLTTTLSLGMTKAEAIDFVCDEIINDIKYYNFVKAVKIKRR